jgi:hypothetical protein
VDHRDLTAVKAAYRLRRHALLFAAVNAGLFVGDLLLPGPVWFIYPLLFWGTALVIHAFLVRAIHLDPAWAEQRTRRLRLLSYDQGHIAQIEAAPFGAAGPAASAGGAAAERGDDQPCRPRT